MTKKAETQPRPSTFVPAITTIAVPLLLFGRHKKEANQTPQQSTEQAPPKPKKKLTGLSITKYEIAGEKIKFQDIQGLFKKRLVTVKEFPIYEVSAVESSANWLSLIWKDETYSFLLKKKTDSFAKLQEQIQSMLLEHKTALEKQDKTTLRRKELLNALDVFLPIVDSSFDILMGLHQKRADWSHLEAIMQPLGNSFSFKAESLPPLEINFSNISAAIESQAAKETSKETFNALKTIHDYFQGLKAEDDLADGIPNFEHVKAVIMVYYTLNDLLLAKITGERDSKIEVSYLDSMIKMLSMATNVKLGSETLLAIVNRLDVGVNRVDVVGVARALFREQLKLL
jgi:hypothetical protein